MHPEIKRFWEKQIPEKQVNYDSGFWIQSYDPLIIRAADKSCLSHKDNSLSYIFLCLEIDEKIEFSDNPNDILYFYNRKVFSESEILKLIKLMPFI